MYAPENYQEVRLTFRIFDKKKVFILELFAFEKKKLLINSGNIGILRIPVAARSEVRSADARLLGLWVRIPPGAEKSFLLL
jgi:hypothetical protein